VNFFLKHSVCVLIAISRCLPLLAGVGSIGKPLGVAVVVFLQVPFMATVKCYQCTLALISFFLISMFVLSFKSLLCVLLYEFHYK